MIFLRITDQIKKTALINNSDKIKDFQSRLRYSEYKPKSINLIETIGWLVFKDYLESQKIQYNFEFPDNYDCPFSFKIHSDIVEALTCGYDHDFNRLNVLYPAKQLIVNEDKKIKYCIQIFVNGYSKFSKKFRLSNCYKAVLAGFIEFDNIRRYSQLREHDSADFKIPLNKLHGIDLLMKKYK